MSKKIVILPGDGIGPEIVTEGIKVLEKIRDNLGLDIEWETALMGGVAYDAKGDPLPEETLALCRDADAILFGAVGGPVYDKAPRELRPERGLLRLRSELNLFSNLRPAILYPQLEDASTLKPEVVSGLDIMILRELTGGIYFGQPRGVETLPSGERRGFNTLEYTESEIERIGRSAFDIAMKRNKRVCSVIRLTCSNFQNCGVKSWKKLRLITLRLSCRICMLIMLQCNWCERQSSLMSSLQPICLAIFYPTQQRC